MPAPKVIQDLVARFEERFSFYQSNEYNEEDLRHEFLNPFFKELGWDLENEAGRGLDRDVRFEARIKSGAPDFGFYVNGKIRFFVEAKNPSRNVCDDPGAAFQLRSYGWSAGVTRSILTDFEEFSIYDTTVKPKEGDKSRIARLECIKYTQFVDRWDEIASLFSREAVASGALEKLRGKRGKGRQPVDEDLLEDISRWRELLAKNIAIRNVSFSEEKLNTVVQDTLDRIIFLRVCEDRGIEHEGKLHEVIEGEDIYPKLFRNFKKAEQRYDSGLFKLPREPELVVEDKVLKEIVSELYLPKSPYRFDAIPADILGQVYEQFLGKVIRLTEGHHAKVEEKPEVRRAGGVYYTPTYIVEYIVKNTVGELLKGKSLKEVKNFSVLDPACGSGSFLIGAYQYLMDWHLRWYVGNDAEKYAKAKTIYRDQSGEWQLTIPERTRILTSHIYGVDIDPQAAEVAKLSLMLKALEAHEQQSLFNERILPNLSSNIKCGNSLISPDYFNSRQSFEPVELAKTNAFSWESEFSNIMQAGGFSVVIGNPPWGQKEIAKDREKISYLRAKYPSAHGIFDLFRPFVELGVSLVRRGGFWGFVLPDIVLLKNYPSTRKFLLENVALKQIDYWGHAFKDAEIDAVTIIGRPHLLEEMMWVDVVIREEGKELRKRIAQSDFSNNDQYKFNLFLTQERKSLIAKLIKESEPLGDLLEIHEGVHSGNVRSKLFLGKASNKNCKPLVLGRDELRRYEISWAGRYIDLTPGLIRKGNGEYANTGKPEWYAKEKLVIRRTGDSLVCALDRDGLYFSNNAFIGFTKEARTFDSRYILGLLNSSLMTWYYLAIQPRKGRVFSEVKINQIATFPIKKTSDDKETALGKEIIRLVEQRIEIGKKRKTLVDETQLLALERQTSSIEREIDRMVYAIYGLTEVEIRVVESG